MRVSNNGKDSPRIFKPQYGQPFYVRVESPILASSSAQGMRWMHVTNLETGQLGRISAKTVLVSELKSHYPNDGYVGRTFELTSIEPAKGKTYETCRINEVKVRGPIFEAAASGSDSVEPAELRQPAKSEIPLLKLKEEWNTWYDKYLKSTLWKKKIKPRILERDSHRCLRCGGPADRVHHRSYTNDVMKGNADDKLASVCEGCHNVIHFDDSANRRDRNDWDGYLSQRDERIDFPPPVIDARKSQGDQKKPDDWDRMNALQRDGWDHACRRQWAIRKFRNQTAQAIDHARRVLQLCGLNNSEIDLLIAGASNKAVRKLSQ